MGVLSTPVTFSAVEMSESSKRAENVAVSSFILLVKISAD